MNIYNDGYFFLIDWGNKLYLESYCIIVLASILQDKNSPTLHIKYVYISQHPSKSSYFGVLIEGPLSNLYVIINMP